MRAGTVVEGEHGQEVFGADGDMVGVFGACLGVVGGGFDRAHRVRGQRRRRVRRWVGGAEQPGGRGGDGLGGDAELVEDRPANPVGEQPGQQVFGPDLNGAGRLGELLGACQAVAQPGPQRHVRRQDRRSGCGGFGEAFAGGLFADPEPGTDLGPRPARFTRLRDDVVDPGMTTQGCRF